jgi:hypothetical protein
MHECSPKAEPREHKKPGDPNKNHYAITLRRLYRRARAKALSAQKCFEIAPKTAKTRWEKK